MLVAIVQARMSSNRLPGKVLNPILGKPMIQWLMERLGQVRRIDQLVLATSVGPENDPLEACVRELGFDVYRGSEEDVLDRFYQAAKPYNPQTVVRITGDCPLIDPALCDQVIDLYEKSRADYAQIGLTFAEGLDCEVMSFAALETAWGAAKLKSEREHVTLYLRNHPELFQIRVMEKDEDDSRYRITVDNPEDFVVVSGIIGALSDKAGGMVATWAQIKEFLDKNPGLRKINAHIVRNEGLQKSLAEDNLI